MPCLSFGFHFLCTQPPKDVLLPWKAHSIGCKLKPRLGIHRDKLMKQFSLHSCDFIRWIMGAADFMDQMTASARSVDSGLSNYPVNVINGDSNSERQQGRGVSCFWDWKPHQIRGWNVLSKGLGSGESLVPLHCLHMSSALLFPLVSRGRSIFLHTFLSGHMAQMSSVWIASNFWSFRKTS